MKLAVAALCTMFVASAYGQSMAELMAMSAMFGNRGSSSSSSSNPFAALASASGSSSSSSNPLAALASTGGASNPLAAITGASGGSSNPFAALTGGAGASNNPMGGNMGRMAGGMIMGGAEMSNLMDFYSCGMMRLPYQMCFLMMQQNM